jgi:hypothetical protein
MYKNTNTYVCIFEILQKNIFAGLHLKTQIINRKYPVCLLANFFSLSVCKVMKYKIIMIIYFIIILFYILLLMIFFTKWFVSTEIQIFHFIPKWLVPE